MSSPAYDECVATVDRRLGSFERGVVGLDELVWLVLDDLDTYIVDALDPRDDVDLLVAYVREHLGGLADRIDVMDGTLIEHVERHLAVAPLLPVLRCEADFLLDEIRSGLVAGRAEARDKLEALCAHGSETHRRALAVRDDRLRVLDLAAEYGVVAALFAAVDPAGRCYAQLASRAWRNGLYRYTFDLLAHLASTPRGTVGAQARDALVALCDHLETAGDAAVRLPVHLLDDHQRRSLATSYERRVDLLEGDEPFVAQLSRGISRDTGILRAAVFQAMDASRR